MTPVAVAVQVEILAAKLSFINNCAYFNKLQGRESTSCRTKTAIVYPEIEYTSEKASA